MCSYVYEPLLILSIDYGVIIKFNYYIEFIINQFYSVFYFTFMFNRRYMYQRKGSSDFENISILFLTTDKEHKKNIVTDFKNILKLIFLF